ncbi:MAG: ArsR family transcriptional regulator [Candidatus Micrarchaeia archaeon]|jgi:DNA-binding transcriptional ArsR family regulator
MDPMKRLLYWLLEGTKGGPTRVLLLSLLSKKPMNMRQLALSAKLDYKTVEHHVELLLKNSVLEHSGNGYGQVYFISDIALAQSELGKLIKGGRNGKKQN